MWEKADASCCWKKHITEQYKPYRTFTDDIFWKHQPENPQIPNSNAKMPYTGLCIVCRVCIVASIGYSVGVQGQRFKKNCSWKGMALTLKKQ